MSAVATPALVVRVPSATSRWREFAGPAWPLKFLLLGFPLWWALGLAAFIFPISAAVMAVQMYRRGIVRLPAGAGVWLLFLAWLLVASSMLWVNAPGTEAGGGPGRLIGYTYWLLWYGSVTVALFYPLSFSSRALPTRTVASWLSVMFLYVVAGGLAGVIVPHFQFTSPVELLIPSGNFLRNHAHPAVSTASDFLGYDQPRPKAPFAYPNAWGNNLGLLLPFFVWSWFTSERRWQRWAVPVVLSLAVVPIVMSLNRGLWLGLTILVVYAAVSLARQAKYAALLALVGLVSVAAIIVLVTPIAGTVQKRLETPHSNERRSTVAQTVTETTFQGSPLLGYGSTRQVAGSFSSIAGGETPNCHQCAAPPMGTQGFIWRLIFTTGVVGAVLFLVFVGIQLWRHGRRTDPISIIGCMLVVVSLLFSLVYDSLQSPLVFLMIAIALMNRDRLEDVEANLRSKRIHLRAPRRRQSVVT